MKQLTATFQGSSTLGNLTPGKEYNVIEVRGGGFGIVDDEGDEIWCLETGCGFIKNKNWKIK